MVKDARQNEVENKKIVCWASPGCIHQCGLIAGVDDGRLVGIDGKEAVERSAERYLRYIRET